MIRFYIQTLIRCAVSWGGYFFCALREIFGVVPQSPSKIAIIQLGHLGDIVLTTPLVLALREKYPAATIDFLTIAYSKKAAEFLLPENTKIIVYNSGKFSRGGDHPDEVPGLTDYDVILYIRGDFCLLLNAFKNLKTGFISCLATRNRLRWSFLYHIGIPVEYHSRHQYEDFKRAADKLLVQLPDSPALELKSGWTDEFANQIGSSPAKYVVVHPGAPWPSRRWPAENFAEICSFLQREYGLKVVVIGGEDSSVLLSSLGERHIEHVYIGASFDFPKLSILLKNCRLYVGNDSGPAHLAAACGVAVIAVYGPEIPEVFGVRGESAISVYGKAPCSPCWQTNCIYEQRCLQNLTVESVLLEIKKLLK